VAAAVAAVVALYFAAISALAAKRSAHEASALATVERARWSHEKERRHEDLAPPHPILIGTDIRLTNGQRFLTGYIQLPRVYDMVLDIHVPPDKGSAPIPMAPWEQSPNWLGFVIAELAPEGPPPFIETVNIRFWPPTTSFRGMWRCPCGRPEKVDPAGVGHWELAVPVAPPREHDSQGEAPTD
jgi:hypothetical protein